MKSLILALLFSASFVVAQDNPSTESQKSAPDKNSITVQGCISRLSGDYILMKQDPAVTYELQATGKIRLRNYLGQRVEVTGVQFPTLSTSSDILTKTGSAAPLTINIKSIKTISKECTSR
jgi:hypothetical protein